MVRVNFDYIIITVAELVSKNGWSHHQTNTPIGCTLKNWSWYITCDISIAYKCTS